MKDNLSAKSATGIGDIHQETIPILNSTKIRLTAYISPAGNDSPDQRKPAILILPGGAFLFCAPSEGEPVAMRFLEQGYQAFVLEYTTYRSNRNNKEFMPQLCEIAECLSIIHTRAEEWMLNPSRLCLMGFSAGANLAACYSTYWKETFIAEQHSNRVRRSGRRLFNRDDSINKNRNNGIYWDGMPIPVKAVVLSYPVLDRPDNDRWAAELQSNISLSDEEKTSRKKFKNRSNRTLLGTDEPDEDILRRASALYHLNPDVPPTFIWHTAEDEMVHPVQSMKYAEGLYSLGISCELHVFDKGPHALALADDETAAAHPWMMLVLRWLDRNLK